MVFTINPTSATGEIQDVILFIRFVHGSGNRVVAEWDDGAGAWVAHPWQTGEGQPAWTYFEFYWRVRTSGASVDTGADCDRTMRIRPASGSAWKSDLVVLYWYGFGDPDAIAQRMADLMAATQERREQGWTKR